MITQLELQQAEAIKKLVEALIGGEEVTIGYAMKASGQASALLAKEDQRIRDRVNAMVDLEKNKNFTMRF